MLFEDRRREAHDGRFTRPNAMCIGSFSSLPSATNLVNSTLARNSVEVALVANGIQPVAMLRASFSSITGKEAYAPSLYSVPMVRETSSVKVLIINDRSSPRGYRVHTAYPTRY